MRKRINSIDLLRGIVMVIMALDHVRDFFHNDVYLHNPLDLKTTTPILFFTRWITHFCAPIFLFLAGISAYLMSLKKTKNELSLFLIKRGIWLILVEMIIVTLGITFNLSYAVIILQVIWAIGISMLILGILVRLPFTIILIISICIVFGHNLLDYPEAAHHYQVGFLWDLIHNGRFSFYPFAKGHGILIAYAFLPWTGIMLLGYCMGKLFEPSIDPLWRKKILIYSGSGLIILFIVVRLINHYGDPVPWSVQRNGIYSFLSFINVNKYPPSLLYISLTIGTALIFLAITENLNNKITSIFIIYGRVPFFYYVIHFYLIHILDVIVLLFAGYNMKQIIVPNVPFHPEFGFDLGIVYLIWIFVVIVMYPLCKWYNRYKSTHRQWWLSYL